MKMTRQQALDRLELAREVTDRNTLTIAQLRKANAKLRKELERVRDKCHENWEHAQSNFRDLEEAHRTRMVVQSMFDTLANAIGRKA